MSMTRWRSSEALLRLSMVDWGMGVRGERAYILCSRRAAMNSGQSSVLQESHCCKLEWWASDERTKGAPRPRRDACESWCRFGRFSDIAADLLFLAKRS